MKTKEELTAIKENTDSEIIILSEEELSLVNGAGETGEGRVEPDSGPGAAGTGKGFKSYLTSQY